MLNVLFVDEEKNVLSGMKRTLRSYAKECNLFFTSNSDEALRILEQNKIEVVVSELAVTTKEQEPFLKVVKEKYPSIIRIIFTDEVEKAKLMDALGYANYFLNKPFKTEELKLKIEHGFYVQSILEDPTLKEVISKVETLPSMPNIYLQINEELSKENFSLQKIANLIEKDISMIAELLKIVNSGFFPIGRRIESVFDAVSLLGVETIRALTLSLNLFRSAGKERDVMFLLSMLTRHSLLVAQGAKKYSKHFFPEKKLEETAFLAGMLHDIGKLVIYTDKNLMEQINDELIVNVDDILKLEKKTFGVTHAEIGAYLLSLWGMPYDIVEAVAFHHSPEKIKESRDSLPFTLYIANIVAEITKIDVDYLNELNIKGDLVNIISILKS